MQGSGKRKDWEMGNRGLHDSTLSKRRFVDADTPSNKISSGRLAAMLDGGVWAGGLGGKSIGEYFLVFRL